MLAGTAQSVYRLHKGWKVQRSNPGGRRGFHIRPDRPRGPPSLMDNDQRVSFAGLKRPSSADFKERVEL